MSDEAEAPVEIEIAPGRRREAVRRWLTATLAAMLSAVISVVLVAVFFPDLGYRAEARIQIQSNLFRHHSRFAGEQSELIRSREVMEKVVAEPDIARFPEIRRQRDPAGWLCGQINIRSARGSQRYAVSLDGMEPNRSARIVNAVVSTYIRLQSEDEVKLKRINRVISLLEEDAARHFDRVAMLRQKLRIRWESTGGRMVSGTISLQIMPLEGQIIELDAEQSVPEAQRQVLQEMIEPEGEILVREDEIKMALEADLEIRELEHRLIRQSRYLAQIERESPQGRDDPRFRAVEMSRARFIRAHTALRATRRDAAIAAARARVLKNSRKELMRLEATIARNQATLDQLRERLLEQSPAGVSQIAALRTELAREEKLVELILNRALKLRTEYRRPAEVTLIKQATPPSRPTAPLGWPERITRISPSRVIVAFLLALVLSYGSGVWLGYMRNSSRYRHWGLISAVRSSAFRRLCIKRDKAA